MGLHVLMVFVVVTAWNIATTDGGNLFIFIIYEDGQWQLASYHSKRSYIAIYL